jgi:RHS repeat-associated protein
VTRSFAYNAANRMASVSLEGEHIMSYRYNGAGERVYRSGSNEVVHTVFDPSGQWIGDYDANGAAIQQAVWFDGLPVGLVRNAGNALDLHYVEADALGTPRVVIDPTRDVAVWRWDLSSEAFGESEPQQDPDGDGTLFVLDMRYPGQQYDSASGFNYNYFHDYDPSVGRYVKSDPIGLNGGMSTYGYVGGNPLTSIDPHGLVAYLCQKGSVLGIGIPINFVGGTDEQVKSMVQSIEKYWKGNIGGYVVRTSVVVSRNLPHDPTGNTIQVVQGEGTSYVDFPNGNTGAWFTNSGWGDMTPAHEAGHLMGLPDYSTGIMTY